MDTSLDERIRRQLNDRKGEWQSIAAGSGVSYSWLSKFVNGHIKNPGFATLKKLAECLDGASPPLPAAEPAETPMAGESRDDAQARELERAIRVIKGARLQRSSDREGPGAADERHRHRGHPGSSNRERHPR